MRMGNAHNTHAVAVRNIIDGDIKTVRHVPRKTDTDTYRRYRESLNQRVFGFATV